MSKFFDKSSEFAPGIPERGVVPNLPTFSNPQKFEFVLQSHNADRAGQHFDLRLGDPATNIAHSWVIRSWPKVGEKVLAIQQQGHTVKYMDFQGEIKSGYGKGMVNIADRDQIEVIKSSPGKVTFHKYKGGGIEKFTLIKTNGDQWLLLNHTHSGELGKYFNAHAKYKMKELPMSYVPTSDEFVSPKIDGAYALAVLRPNKNPILLSSRVSKKTGTPIEYTPKMYDMVNKLVPKNLGNTVLRTEVYAIDSRGNEVPNRVLGGMLNANVWKSREMQKELGAPLRAAVTDVLTYKGKDVSGLDAKQKYELIDKITKEYPSFDNPLELQRRTNFKEGKIIWKGNIPYKQKNTPDYDVYVKDIFINKNGDRAGGFKYSLTPDGPIVGNVGTGWKHQELRDMKENPNEYIGRVAKIRAMEQHPSGAYRSASFLDWHLDK